MYLLFITYKLKHCSVRYFQIFLPPTKRLTTVYVKHELDSQEDYPHSTSTKKLTRRSKSLNLSTILTKTLKCSETIKGKYTQNNQKGMIFRYG